MSVSGSAVDKAAALGQGGRGREVLGPGRGRSFETAVGGRGTQLPHLDKSRCSGAGGARDVRVGFRLVRVWRAEVSRGTVFAAVHAGA